MTKLTVDKETIEQALEAHNWVLDYLSTKATHTEVLASIAGLRAALALAQPVAEPANGTAYSAACNLATALFKKHFAHLPDFASGQAVWSLCDSTAGVISQIDNMVSGLVQPPTTSPQADSVLEDAARLLALEAAANQIFNNPPSETSQDVRDVIEWFSGSIRVVLDAAIKQGEKP